ncbi:MAG: ATP-binding protein [Bacteroidota bacterium]
MSNLKKNSSTISRELKWLADIIDARFRLYFNHECEYESVFDISPPSIEGDDSVYARCIKALKWDFAERFIVVLALSPHVLPAVLDVFFTKNVVYDRVYTEFGGLKGAKHSGFIPTCETAVFLLGGRNMEDRLSVMKLFEQDQPLFNYNILKFNRDNVDEPMLSNALNISREYLNYLTNGEKYKPDFSTNFPAKLITTPLDWEDLVLDKNILQEVFELKAWIKHKKTLMETWGLKKLIKPGYRALFHGPPGTGKTLTATLLGKSTELDVYRIDLSQLVSKYIGETEKNLANIFDQAENKNWILFFDEADALFGKRSVTSDAKDRYANQEIAYLLQRIEDYPGVIILATNLKANIDSAFSRRFQSIIYFPLPNVEQRLALWENAFLDKCKLGPDVDLLEIATEHEISGGAIINVLRSSSLSTLSRGEDTVNLQDILKGIRKEYRKEGKTI